MQPNESVKKKKKKTGSWNRDAYASTKLILQQHKPDFVSHQPTVAWN